jgi:hypothetical protein
MGETKMMSAQMINTVSGYGHGLELLAAGFQSLEIGLESLAAGFRPGGRPCPAGEYKPH